MHTPIHHEPGEDMNVRAVHGALWRELAEPIERWRRTPWYLRHFYAIMAILALIYIIQQAFDWNEYEENAVRRVERNEMLKSTKYPAP